MPTLVFEIPIETVSEANVKEHWAVKAKRAKKQRMNANYFCVLNAGRLKLDDKAKIEVILVRMSPKQLDDDNLRSSLKAVRDGIADWLKIDDGSDRITWMYEQMKIAKTRSIMVTITILGE